MAVERRQLQKITRNNPDDDLFDCLMYSPQSETTGRPDENQIVNPSPGGARSGAMFGFGPTPPHSMTSSPISFSGQSDERSVPPFPVSILTTSECCTLFSIRIIETSLSSMHPAQFARKSKYIFHFYFDLFFRRSLEKLEIFCFG